MMQPLVESLSSLVKNNANGLVKEIKENGVISGEIFKKGTFDN